MFRVLGFLGFWLEDFRVLGFGVEGFRVSGFQCFRVLGF